VQVLQRATSDDALAPIVSALPVAGFSGSLMARYADRGDQGRGVVRAKTGTLTGVDALAGYTRDANGTPLVFAVMADHVAVPNTLKARNALDDLATALTTCRCG
jgi:D-alanyl-D-alanine carboxypeptidase/D-alanyl-D-alanine-endopeptidase (penicillin-binding protein 4)